MKTLWSEIHAVRLVIGLFTVRVSVVFVVFFTSIMWTTPGNAQATYEPSEITKVVLLGTGTPNPEPERWGPATAIIVHDQAYLIDFGPGVVRRASAAHQMGVKALKPSKLTRAFLTHLHSDHTTGYPDLIFSPWVVDREEPLQVYGPEGLDHMTQKVVEAYEQDMYMRVFGLEPRGNRGWRVKPSEIAPGVVYEDDNVSVEAFRVSHGTWPNAFGFKFTTPDRTIVISGDTRYDPIVAEKAKGVDILVHEVYSVEGLKERKPLWRKYHKAFHTSTYDVARIANKAEPGLLVLTHQLFMGQSPEELVAEIKSRYDGEVVSGKDLDAF